MKRTGGATTQPSERPPDSMAMLRTMRDEIRLKIHLASMDVKDDWSKLERRLEELESKGRALTSKASESFDTLLQAVQAFRDTLKQASKQEKQERS